MVFTALPLAARATFDIDVHYLRFSADKGPLTIKYSENIRKMLPYIYRVGQLDMIFNNLNFLIWISKGILHGFVVWLITVYSCEHIAVSSSGGQADFWFVSITMFTSIFLVVTLQQILMIYYWTWFNVLSLTVLSVFAYFGWIFLADTFSSLEVSSVQLTIWTSPVYYLIVGLNMGWFIAYDIGENLMMEWIGEPITKKARHFVQSGLINNMSLPEIKAAFLPKKDANINKITNKAN
jgi:hypothetical protein